MSLTQTRETIAHALTTAEWGDLSDEESYLLLSQADAVFEALVAVGEVDYGVQLGPDTTDWLYEPREYCERQVAFIRATDGIPEHEEWPKVVARYSGPTEDV